MTADFQETINDKNLNEGGKVELSDRIPKEAVMQVKIKRPQGQYQRRLAFEVEEVATAEAASHANATLARSQTMDNDRNQGDHARHGVDLGQEAALHAVSVAHPPLSSPSNVAALSNESWSSELNRVWNNVRSAREGEGVYYRVQKATATGA